jgi:hypothetical protein
VLLRPRNNKNNYSSRTCVGEKGSFAIAIKGKINNELFCFSILQHTHVIRKKKRVHWVENCFYCFQTNHVKLCKEEFPEATGFMR